MRTVEYNRSKLESLCQAYHVLRLSLYGSVLRGEDTPSSDMDLLVEFDPDFGVGFFELARLERSLSELFGRKVDLNTPGFLNKAFRFQVQQHAQPLYAR
ncbi:MAG TPA: nucleotidyltransferase family protein [Candidatus Kapabacteria bacterium]|nr:nucleotidyltransferase family protein [Candidatus Kapabacteria bacterium]